MTWRRTKKDAFAIAGWIVKEFASQGKKQDLTLEWCGATGRGRALLNEGSVNLSPLLATGELVDYLRAYHAGLQEGIALASRPPSDIAKMNSDEIRERVNTDPEWARANACKIVSCLSSIACSIGRTWDKVDMTNPYDGPWCRYGTENKESMTYAFRKAAGFSYP